MDRVPEGPRRKSLAGPLVTATNTANRRSFAVTNTYYRGQDRLSGVDGLLKGFAVVEDIKTEGNVNVTSIIETTKDVLCCQYTEEFDGVAAGFVDGMVRVFNSLTNECIQTLYDSETEENTSPVTGIKHRPVTRNYPITNSLTCTYASGCVKCWNYNFCQCLFTIREKRQTFGLSYHPKLPKFVTYGDDLRIYLYDEETRTQERILASSNTPGAIDGHTSRIFSACFNPRSPNELVTGGWDDVIHFWDLRQPYSLRHISGIHMCGDGIDISPKGSEILSCAWQRENPLQIWDYGSGKLIGNLEPDVYGSLLYAGRYINKDFMVTGGTEPNLLRLVDLRTYATSASIRNFHGGVYCVDIGPVKKSKKPEGKNPAPQRLKSGELATLPKIAFCTGKKVFQIDFS